MSKNDMGIDLGTANTLVYLKSKGVVLNEPSVVAVDNQNSKILAVGIEAKRMLGRTPEKIRAVRPLRDGVISDFEFAGAMLEYFIKKALKKTTGMKPKAVICVPTGITSVEKKAVEEAAFKVGVRHVHLMEEPMAAALGADLDVSAPSGIMVVDIGGGTTEVAVISLGGIVVCSTVKLGGDALDRAIIKYVRQKYGILTGEQTAEMLKLRIGTVLNSDSNYRELLSGRNTATGMPCSSYITGEDIRSALLPAISGIIDTIKSVLEETPPELSADILKSGITLTGGGALIDGLDRLICDATGIPVKIADNPLECVARGAGKLVDKKYSANQLKL